MDGVYKMRCICSDKRGISNVLGYLLSFSVAAIVMVSSVIMTTNIINDRTVAVADLQAQSVANKVADAIVESIVVGQSTPGADYKRTLDIPLDIAGRSYYIEVTNTMVYVNTTDGLVSESCPNYGAESLNLGVSGGRTYGGAGSISISMEETDVVYGFDFGTGDITSHSPVESGYYMVSDNSSSTDPFPPWWNTDYHCRIPILVENDSPEDLFSVPVKVVLNPTNFDYSLANVTVNSSTNVVTSDLVFHELSGGNFTTKISISPNEWEPRWFYDEQTETVNVTIEELPGGYTVFDVDGDTLMLNTQVSRISWDEDNGIASFNRREALESLEPDESHFLYSDGYTVIVSGSLKNGMGFHGSDSISIKNPLYVDDDYEGYPIQDGSLAHPFEEIQDAIDAAGDGYTIFVYTGVYDNIYIDKGSTAKINLIGQDQDGTIIMDETVPQWECGVEVHDTNLLNIDSFTIIGGYHLSNSVELNGCRNVNITNCDIKNGWNGIYITGSTSKYNYITNCEIYNHGADGFYRPLGNTSGILMSGDANHNWIINCTIRDNGNSDSNSHDDDGIRITGTSTGANRVINCNIENNGGGGERGDGIEISQGANSNWIINCNISGSTDDNGAGIKIHGDATDHNHVINSTCSDNHRGIYIYKSGSSTGNEIKNCVVYGNKIKGISLVGTSFDKCKNNLIANCEIYDNANQATADGDGIYLEFANQNTISNCVIYHNGDDGIHMNGGSLNPACDNTIVNCAIYDNGYYATVGGHGINLFRAGDDGHPNNFSNCIIYNNTDHGINIIGSKYNEIFKCSIFKNEINGINITSYLTDYSKFNSIKSCSIYLNKNAGVCIQKDFYYLLSWHGCYDNKIHYNNFGDNNGENAIDNSEHDTNNWNTNFWDDHDGSDEYEIPPYGGSTQQIDNDPHGPDWTKTTEQGGPFPNPDVIIVKKIEGISQSPPPHYHTDSIQVGIENVQPGGTVFVKPAEDDEGGLSQYYENDLQIYKSLNLIGMPESGMEVIVDPHDGGTDYIFWVPADYVNISGFTIKNGTRGIELDGNNINITNCNINNNTEAGIYSQSDDYNRIVNCEIHYNKYGIQFYATSAEYAEQNSIINCDIHHNTERGIYFQNRGKENDITNCDIHHNGKDGIIFSSSDQNNITNCNIYENNEMGIYLSGSEQNSILNCDIYDNEEDGVYIYQTSTLNEITKCSIRDNWEHGIQIRTSSDSNIITNCDINNNDQHGIYLSSSDENNITDCDIHGNTNCGVNITGSSDGNNITDCDINDNDQYGIYLASSNSNIYNNKFASNTGGNAFDSGSNSWDNGYPYWLPGGNPGQTGGNLWDDYDEEFDGAYDYYHGPNQVITGGDSIADQPYNITGGSNQDHYPWCRRGSLLPYYIDYWNPYGDSVILVNMSVGQYNSTWIYLYCDYDGSLDESHNHSISEISVFSDDFSDVDSFIEKWDLSDVTDYTLENSCITFDSYNTVEGEYIMTKNYSIPVVTKPVRIPYSSTVNESMYIAEVKMKVNEIERTT